MEYNPFAPPEAPLELSEDVKNKIQSVISSQKRLIASILFLFVPSIMFAIFRPEPVGPAFLVVFVLLTIAAYLFCFTSIFKLAKSLESAPWLYIIVMFIPYINLLFLFKLNNEATNFLKDNNIKVGLFGAQNL